MVAIDRRHTSEKQKDPAKKKNVLFVLLTLLEGGPSRAQI